MASRVALIIGLAGVLAGPAAPITGAATSLTVTTPYPAIVVEPGSTGTFALTIDTTAGTTVSLSADGVPSGWTSSFRGSGTVVDSVYVDAKSPDLSFSVDVPSDAAAGSHTITINANGGGQSSSLQVTVKIEPAAAGDVTLAVDFPQLKGTASNSFTFNVTLKNGTPSQGTFSLDANGPGGWSISAKPAASSQATSFVVDAGATSSITLSATPSADATAGDYPVTLTVSGAGKTASLDVKVTITGSYGLSVSTPDTVLSTTANAGTEKDFTISVTNTGTAPVTQIAPSASAPTGWKVTFSPATIDSLAAGQAQNLVAQIVPTSDAIAGDYNVTMTTAGAEATGNVVIRVRVETPAFWWIAGIALILAVFAALYWVFRTYGRR